MEFRCPRCRTLVQASPQGLLACPGCGLAGRAPARPPAAAPRPEAAPAPAARPPRTHAQRAALAVGCAIILLSVGLGVGAAIAGVPWEPAPVDWTAHAWAVMASAPAVLRGDDPSAMGVDGTLGARTVLGPDGTPSRSSDRTFELEWGANGIDLLSRRWTASGAPAGERTWCAPDVVVTVPIRFWDDPDRHGTSQRPWHSETHCEIWDANPNTRLTRLEEAQLASNVTLADDGTVTFQAGLADIVYDVTLDAAGRLWKVVVRQGSSELESAEVRYGPRRDIVLPEELDRPAMAIDVSRWEVAGGFEFMLDPGELRGPLSEFTVTIRADGLGGELPEAATLLELESPLELDGIVVTFRDDDESGTMSRGDVIAVEVPERFSGYTEVIFHDTWAERGMLLWSGHP